MKVVHLHTNKAWGGGEDQVLHLLQGLKEHGCSASCFAHPDGALLPRGREKGLDIRPLPASALLKRNPMGTLALAKELRAMDTMLVHAHDSFSATLATGVGQRNRCPVVLARRIASPLRRNFFSRRKYSEGRVACFIAISNTVKRALVDSGVAADRIYVVGDGLRLDLLDKVLPAVRLCEEQVDVKCVGGLGMLSKKKNWGYMLRVAAELKSRGLCLRWFLAGSGPEEEALKGLARELEVEAEVCFLGFQEASHAVIKALDVLFFPSLMEGASVTVRESMAMRVPVVTVDTPGSVESLNGHGWVVSAGDVVSAADAVEEALYDVGKREAFVSAAYEDALRRFDIEETIRGTLEVYRLFGVG